MMEYAGQYPLEAVAQFGNILKCQLRFVKLSLGENISYYLVYVILNPAWSRIGERAA